MPARERTCTAKNRVRELRSPGSVRDEGSNVLVYSDVMAMASRDNGAINPRLVVASVVGQWDGLLPF